MTFIADALGGWLIGQVAAGGRKRLGDWLLGTEQERALQQAATAAIHATAEQFRPKPAVADDAQGADHLARVIDHVFEKPQTPAESLAGHSTLLEGLQAGVAARLATLGDVYLTGTGESSAQVLGISVPALAEQLTHQLLRELVARGARSRSPRSPPTVEAQGKRSLDVKGNALFWHWTLPLLHVLLTSGGPRVIV
jgi:hypothetical protein